MACSDGTVRTFYTSGGPYSVGRLVSVTLDSSGTTIKSMQSKSLSGKVSSDGTSFADYDFASDVEILDTDGEGSYARIYPSRLAGYTLKSSDVVYYTLNSQGEIDCLILSNVTGDTAEYVYLSGVEDNSTSGSGSIQNISVTYTYIQDGETQTLNSDRKYSIKTGGAALGYDEDGQVDSMKQLDSVTLDSLSGLTAVGDGRKYTISEQVQVLLRDDDSRRSYYLTDLSEINAQDYDLTGWYDDLDHSAGGHIRIIVATPKE